MEVVETLFEMQAFLKVVLLIVTYPIWGKVLRAMWQEIQRGLADDGGVFGTADIEGGPRSPGEDPFLNIPRAQHRRGRPDPSANAAAPQGGAGQAAADAAPRATKRAPRF